ncbi:MAG: hypothetical protein H7Z41_01825 [Cytophagales bacterium]|nr:hypothetical protein [Armatimonadota bacterium]
MRVRAKELRAARKRREERYKAAHKGDVATAAVVASAASAAARPAPSRPARTNTPRKAEG